MMFLQPAYFFPKTQSYCVLGVLSILFYANPGLLAQSQPSSRTLASAGGGFLGVGVAEINPDRAKVLKTPADALVEITRVEPGTPADGAGIKTGDVVLQFNGQPVESVEQFVHKVRDATPGHRIKIVVIRNGMTQTLTVVLGTRKAREPRAELFPVPGPQSMPGFDNPVLMMPGMGENGQGLALGVEVEALSPQLAEYFGVQNGVLVRSVKKDTPASLAGFRAGDVVVKVDGTRIEHPGDLLAAVHAPRSSKTLTVRIFRDHREMTLSPVFDDKANSEQDENAPRDPDRK